MAQKKRKQDPLVKILSRGPIACAPGKTVCEVKRRPGGKFDAVIEVPGFTYTQPDADACSFMKGKTSRATGERNPSRRCPVQTTFKDGRAFLRFCRAPGQPGRLLRLPNPDEARRVAAEACRCWSASHKDVEKRSFAGCYVTVNGREVNLDAAPLGRTTKRPGRQRRAGSRRRSKPKGTGG